MKSEPKFAVGDQVRRLFGSQWADWIIDEVRKENGNYIYALSSLECEDVTEKDLLEDNKPDDNGSDLEHEN